VVVVADLVGVGVPGPPDMLTVAVKRELAMASLETGKRLTETG